MSKPILIERLGLKADLNSPIFTGTPEGPTAPLGTASTQLATTEFVQNNSSKVSATNKLDEKMYLLGALEQIDGATTGTNENIFIENNVLFGAAWNDYAEFRETEEKIEPGRVVIENGDGKLILSSERLQPAAYIVSDTYGFAIGRNEVNATPLALCGRVLAYTDCDKNNFSLGDVVCSGKNGTISKMNRDEIIKYPDRIIGVVSEIPNYEFWNYDIKVNNRIWIKI